MIRVVVFLVLVIAGVGFSRPASASELTFNEVGLAAGVGPGPYFSGSSRGTLLTDQVALLGVQFSIDANGAAYISNDQMMGAAGSPSLLGNYLVVNSLPLNGAPTTLHVTFVDPGSGLATTATGISALVSDWNETPDPRVTVNAFDAHGNLVETQNLFSYFARLLFTNTEIARLDFVDNGGDGHIIDNLAFTLNSAPEVDPHSVPEPGTLLLVSAGAAAVTARRRRRA